MKSLRVVGFIGFEGFLHYLITILVYLGFRV